VHPEGCQGRNGKEAAVILVKPSGPEVLVAWLGMIAAGTVRSAWVHQGTNLGQERKKTTKRVTNWNLMEKTTGTAVSGLREHEEPNLGQAEIQDAINTWLEKPGRC
jgi:hypothetical protein